MQRCLPNAGSSEADVMCRGVLEPRMGQSREYVISGEMDTKKFRDRETHRLVSVIFSILR